MNRKDKAFLEINVLINREGMVQMEGGTGRVLMIPFSGTARGPKFNGVVEPCGVDTQVTNANGVRHMSARYMLTGKDQEGAPCHIYVENNGFFTGEKLPTPFKTIPTFMTDSKALAPFLHRQCFTGEGTNDEAGLWIRFYELTDPQEA